MIGISRKYRRARALLLCSAAVLIGPGATILSTNAARAATPIDTNQPFYLQSNVGTTVLPDFEGGTLRDNQNGVTDLNNYTVGNFTTNTIDAFGNTTAFAGTFTGAGSLTIADSVGGGVVVITGASAIGGTVTIDNGATMQWGAGNSGFLVGAGNDVIDNGSLVMDFGGGGIGGAIPISGTGTVEIQSGALTESGASTYTGVTTIDAAGFLNLSGAGSIANSSNVIDNGTLDISGTGAGASITTITGAGTVSLGSQTLTLTNASGTFSGVMADGGLFGGTGGGLTIAGGTETLTGTNTFTGATTINPGATLRLGNGGTTGSVAGDITDNGLLQFNFSNGTVANTISGTGSAEILAGTTVITGASAVDGTVTIDNGAIMQWGAGNSAFLVGGGNSVVDNGSLVMNFGGGGIGGAIPISGTGTVEIQSGALTDSGASTYTGATIIDAAGFLNLSGAGSIADSSNVIDNGTLDISGTGAGASITTITGAGTVSLGAQTLTLTNASGTFAGTMQDGGLFGGTGGGLTIAGGTETLTGTNAFTGLTTINPGATLQLGNGGTTGSVAGDITDNGLLKFDFSNAAVANTISGTGSAEILAGTTVITGTSAIGGTVTIDSGAIMQWGNGGPAFLVGAGNSVVDNGTLTMNFGGGGIAGAIPISGTGGVEIQSGSLNDSGTSTYTGATTIDATGVLALSGAGSIADSSGIADSGTFDISGTTAGASITTITGAGTVSLGAQTLTLTNASGIFSGVMADGGLFGGTGGALTIAGGIETLTGANTYTGPTTIDLGATLQLGNGGTTGSVAGNIVDNGLLKFDYSNATVANTISGTGSADIVAGTTVITGTSVVGGTVTIDNGATMQWGNGGPAFLVGVGNSVVDNGTLTMNFGGGGIAGAIPISGSGTVEIQSGSLNDSGASTYTGATTIDAAGVLALSGAGSIADSSGVADSGTFDISGTGAGASITTITGAGTVSLGGQTLTLTNASGTFSGVMADGGLFGGTGGGLTIAGGTETLTGTNTYTGPTTIDLGATLQLGNGGTTGSVAGAITDNGLLKFDYSNATVANAISGTGSAEVVAGTTVITGTSAIGGTVTIDSGATMQWGNGGPAFLVGGGNSVVDNGTLTMNFGGGGIAGAIPISGSGSVHIESGSLNDSGASTYTGATTIDAAGVLALSGAGSIADSSGVIDNGTFDISGTTAGASITAISGTGTVSLGGQTLTLTNASGTFSSVLADGGLFGGTGGGLTIAGGSEILTGTNTYTGATTINPGATLQLGNGGTTGSVAGGITDNGLLKFDYSNATVANAISGSGSAEIIAGTTVITGTSAIGGTVTIDNGATMQWGNGGPAFLVGAGNGVIDNGALTMNFGGGGIAGAIPISGTGSVTIQSGSFSDSAISTYTGATTIDPGAIFVLTGAGSISSSGDPLVNGTFDISGTTAGTSIVSLSGSGTVDLGSKTLTLTNASDTFSGVIADGGLSGGTGGSLMLAGGTETLSGTSTYTGQTTINGGTLNVTGSIASSSLVAVNSGGTLKGTGTISGATIAAGGTLAPGNPLGTLTLTGNESFAAGSIFDANINAAGQSGNVSAAGKTIINGGTVDVIEAAGHYNPVTKYVLIDSASGVSGTFTNVTSSLANFAPTLIYGPDTVTLDLTQTNFQFGTVFGTTPNQISTGQGVTATGGSSALYLALANFTSANPSAAPAALDSLSGEIHASLLSAMIEDSRMIRDTILDRLAHPEPEGIVLWATGFGDFGHIGGDGNAASVHRQDSGAIVGLEGDLDSHVRAGLAGAYTSQTIDVPARASTASGTSGHLVAYASWNANPFWFSFGVDHGWGSNDVTRHVAFLSETDADHQSNDTTQAFGEVRYEFAMDGGTIAPYGDLVWVEAQTGAFTETGGLDALSGGGKAQHDDYTTLGLRGALDEFSVYGVGVTPRAAAAWQHSLNGFAPTAAFTFAGSNQPFTIIGAPLANNAAALQLGVDIAITPALRFWVGYDGQISDNVQSNAVDGQIAWTF